MNPSNRPLLVIMDGSASSEKSQPVYMIKFESNGDVYHVGNAHDFF